jgi:Type I phosphodiesterase / nucleotide pyrophosphatase
MPAQSAMTEGAMATRWRGAVLAAGLLTVSAGPQVYAGGGGDFGGSNIKRVLLISIDGMHALDFINCAQGISGVNGGSPYCPTLAELAATGMNYLETSTSKPSDSFPGLMALVTGGSPRTVGAFYDVAYDRSLDPPATTTGNGVAGAPGCARPGQLRRARPPSSTRASISTRPS